VDVGHAVFALVALDELAQRPEHESVQSLMLEHFGDDEMKHTAAAVSLLRH